MAKFSDSPYFLLKDFFQGKGSIYDFSIRRPIIDYNWPVIWEDRDSVTFEDRVGVIWNLRFYFDPNAPTTDGSYLIGHMTNIITNGDGIIDLWIKETEEPYKQFIPIKLRYDDIEDNYFKFTDSGLENLLSGAYTHSISGGPYAISGATYGFDFFDTTPLDYDNYIENGREVYFRKDSIYHEWLTTVAPEYYPVFRNSPTDIRNYVNSDTLYSYFGKIWKYIQQQYGEYRIIFHGMKDFVEESVPAHQRTPNFMEFQEIFFDQLWHEVYNQIKNIWTLLDPMEVDQDFLGYLSKYYYMQDLISPTLFRQREFVRDLVWLLKRKGTYTEFYIIWRAITNTINHLNIYEKWHTRQVWDREDTHVLPTEWKEFIYVEKPEYRYDASIGGAGVGWYMRTYDDSGYATVLSGAPSASFIYPVKVNENALVSNNGEEFYENGYTPNSDIPLPVYGSTPDILSTHYKLEIDVSSEPLLPTAIINKVIWDELWNYWELVRPVNRVVDYNILIAPITDFTGSFVSLYDYSPWAYDLTKTMIRMRTPDGYWSIHTDEDITYTDCPDYPSLSGSSLGESPSGGCMWTINHDLNTKYLHTMAIDTEFKQIVPDKIVIVDNDTVEMYWGKPTYGHALLKKSQTFTKGNGTDVYDWYVTHYRQVPQIVTEFHNTDEKIYGDKVHNLDAIKSRVNTGDASYPTTSPASSGEVIYFTNDESTWEVYHGQFYKGVIVAVYDMDGYQITEYILTLSDIAHFTLEFGKPTSGYVVILPVANYTEEDVISEFRELLLNAECRGSATPDDLLNGGYDYSTGIQPTEIYEDNNFIYFNVEFGTEVECSFREFGIFTNAGRMFVYSKCSELYKAAGTTLVLHFRVEKKYV